MNPCQGPPHRSRVNGAQHRGRRKEKLQPHIGFSTVTVPSLAANGAVNKHSRSHAPSSQGCQTPASAPTVSATSGSHRIGFPRLPSRCSRNWNLWPGSSAVRLKTRCPQGHAPLRLLQGRRPPGLSRGRSSAFWALQTRHSSHLAAFLLRLDWRPHWPCGLARFPL